MDPNVALQEVRQAIQAWRDADTTRKESEAAVDLVWSFEVLDEWLGKGGFLPNDWSKS